jgi:mannosyltransferase
MTESMRTAPVLDDRTTGIRNLFSRPVLAPALVGLLGLAIALVGIGTPSVWYDESATVTSATRSWSQLWAMSGNVDAVHLAYYAVMHVVFDLVGYSPMSLRVPSAIAVGIAAALTVVLGRVLYRPRLGVIAGIVFVLLPRTTWMGTEGRSYALTAALAVLTTILLVLASRNSSRRLWALYAIAVTVSCIVFVYLALVVVAHAVAMAWWVNSSRSRSWPPVARWMRWTALATAVVIPFALAVIGQSGQVHWLPEVDVDTLRMVVVGQWFYTSGWFAVVGWTLLVAGAVALARGPRGLSPASVLLPLVVVPTAALILVSVVAMPVYTPRYLSFCLPFVALVMGGAIDRFAPRGTAVVALAVLAALAVPQIVAQRQSEAKEDSSWSQVADLIASERAAAAPDTTTAIVYGTVQYHPKASARVMAYSYPDAFAGTVDVTLGIPAAETAQLWETRFPLASRLDRLDGVDAVYLITSDSRDQRPQTTETLERDGWRVADTWDLTDVHVLKYERY